MNKLEDLSVVIDLGSYSIKGVVGCKVTNEEGKSQTKPICQDWIKSQGISRGHIKNIEQVSGCIKALITLLENRLIKKLKSNDSIFKVTNDQKLKIKKVYVPISLYGTQSITQTIDMEVPNGEVTKSLIDEAQKLNNNNMRFNTKTKPEFQSYDFFQSFKQAFYINGAEEASPVGMIAKKITVSFLNVLIPKGHLDNITKCMSRAGIDEVKFLLSTTCLAQKELTPKERVEGAVLVDFGAEVFSVSIYKDKKFKYILEQCEASDAITKDLKQLKLNIDDMECIKCNYGNAISSDQNQMLNVNGTLLDLKIINNIIEARISKIIGQIIKATDRCNLTEAIRTIVLVGGGSNLNSMVEKVESTLGINTRLAFDNFDKRNAVGLRAFASALGVLSNSDGKSISIEEIGQPTPATDTEETETKKKGKNPKKGFFRKTKNTGMSLLQNLFGESYNDQFEESEIEGKKE